MQANILRNQAVCLVEQVLGRRKAPSPQIHNQTAQDLNGNDSGQGFDITAGDKGYLREAYHGSPYATHYLLKELIS